MTFLIALVLLTAPGLVSLRILWKGKQMPKDDWKYLVSDYLIYSFLIIICVYGFMFLTYPQRSVSFDMHNNAISHISSASFVFKYSVVALFSSIVLPVFVPWIIGKFQALEKNRLEKHSKKR